MWAIHSQQLVAMAGVLSPKGVVGATGEGQVSLGRVCCVRREEGPGNSGEHWHFRKQARKSCLWGRKNSQG